MGHRQVGKAQDFDSCIPPVRVRLSQPKGLSQIPIKGMRDSSFSIPKCKEFQKQKKKPRKEAKKSATKRGCPKSSFLLRYSIKKMQSTQTSTETDPVQIFRF